LTFCKAASRTDRHGSLGHRWLIGLTVGAVAGLGTLMGPIGGLLGLAAVALAVADPPRIAAIGGALIGFAVTWLVLVARVVMTCREGCGGSDESPWFLAAAVIGGLGVVLTGRAARRR
jgi:hypothetical protein